MPDDDLSGRVIRLETKVEIIDKNIDALNNRINMMLNNDINHIEKRLKIIEGRPEGGLTSQDWIKIIVAILTAGGAAIVAAINLIGRV